MRSVFFPRLINGPFGDPALYVRIAHRGSALLFDCGDIHPLTPREAMQIRAVFISHAHIDHLIGFGALIRFFLYRETPLLVYGPKGITERIKGQLAGYTWNLIRDYPLQLTVRELLSGAIRETHFRARHCFSPEDAGMTPIAGDTILQEPHFLVRALALDHGDIDSLAFSLAEPTHIAIHKDALEANNFQPGPWLATFKDAARGDNPADAPMDVPLAGGGENVVPFKELFQRIAHRERGMKVTYVTDVSPTANNLDKIIALAEDSHLLVIEAVFSHQDLSLAEERNHLTARLAGEIARRSRAARFLLFHHSPRYRGEAELLLREAWQAFRQDSGEPETGPGHVLK
ncbi:MAG: ribonuclease Z [Desulfuromonadaceae bacterium]|nr:ribonuclease Z [Desulfuromonadaceae bacterium]